MVKRCMWGALSVRRRRMDRVQVESCLGFAPADCYYVSEGDESDKEKIHLSSV